MVSGLQPRGAVVVCTYLVVEGEQSILPQPAAVQGHSATTIADNDNLAPPAPEHDATIHVRQPSTKEVTGDGNVGHARNQCSGVDEGAEARTLGHPIQQARH